MSRSKTSFVLCLIAVFVQCLLLSGASAGQSASPAASDPRTACAADIQKLCAGVAPGGGRIVACLKQNKDSVSDGCKRAVMNAMGKAGGNASPAGSPASVATYPNGAPASPASSSVSGAVPAGFGDDAGSAPTATTGSTAPAASSALAAGSGSTSKSSSTSKQGGRPSTPSASSGEQLSKSGEHLFVMKKVQIIDQGLGKGMVAYDMLIPKDWQFKGAVNVGVAEGGCFDDWFSVAANANNADSSVALQIRPQMTWQYTDDPSGQQQMQAQNQSDVKYGMKACPVRAPVRAQDFLRQDVMKKCGGCTLVSVEPFPELGEMVRHQLGLPPATAGASNGNTRVDAARMRIAFNNTQGQPSEAWVTAAIVVHIMPGGRGAAYDWHAVDVMSFGTPKGQLDANEKLFKLMISTIHPRLEWEKMSNGYIASLYQMKAKQVAIQQQAIAQFRQHAADVINGVTQNQIKGANQAAFGQDQLVRGVQTFRDPATGSTYELSNLYDNAWLNNGANEYVMSDSPNYNPNGDLNGSWNQLELVRPQP